MSEDAPSCCPHCRKEAKLSVWSLLPKHGEHIVTCRSCDRECTISWRTRLLATLVSIAALCALYGLTGASDWGWRGWAGAVTGLVLLVLTNVLTTRLALRLVPTSAQRSGSPG